MNETIIEIMKSLLPKENRTKENINTSIDELNKLKTGNTDEDEYIESFVSLCNYLNGDQMGIYEVSKEMRIWFLGEFK